jgi:NhaA family Na+:H+ antiporter
MKPVTQAHNTSGEPPIAQVLKPLQEFMKNELSGGVLLLMCTVTALVWANSPWGDVYTRVWQTPLSVGIGGWELSKPVLLWINDGLMAVFFFLVGLEIKREILAGELSQPRQAVLPIVAAVGGMVVPAVLFTAVNGGGPGASGWGVPMATDIAFAFGVLTLLGRRIPIQLKIFLISVAIVDDLGAVLVIAFFYTPQISLSSLGVGAVILLALIAANWSGIRHPFIYALLGFGGLWLAFLISGVHATIAGVVAAMAIPARPRIGKREFMEKSRILLTEFETRGQDRDDILANKEQAEVAEALELASDLAQTPLQRMEHALQPWVLIGIMPLFALANAGIVMPGDWSFALAHPVALGVILGLVLGKQIGITLFSWMAVRSGLAELPRRVGWRQLYGVGWLAGIGFTMSLFIANLAFHDPELLGLAKIGILAASLISGLIGWILLRAAPDVRRNEWPPQPSG